MPLAVYSHLIPHFTPSHLHIYFSIVPNELTRTVTAYISGCEVYCVKWLTHSPRYIRCNLFVVQCAAMSHESLMRLH